MFTVSTTSFNISRDRQKASYEQHWLKQAQTLLNGSKRQKQCSSINKYVTTLLHIYNCYDKNNYLQRNHNKEIYI